MKNKMKNIKNMIITHKAEAITISVISVIVISVIIGIVITNKSGKIGTTKRPIASLDLENAIKVEEVKDGEGENITLEVDTKEYEKDEEVAIITEDDGTITIISTSDPKYKEKATGKQVTIGKVTDKGIETTTANSTIIDLSKKPAEEQKNQIVVTPKPDTKPEESPKPTEEPEVKPSEEPTTTPSEEPTSTPSQTTKPSTSPSGNTTSKPSTSPTNTGNQGTTTTPSNPVTPSQPTQPTTPSTPTPTPVYPTGKFVYKPNYSVQSQIIAQLNNIIANTEIHQVTGTTVTSGSSCSSGRYTYRGVSSFTSGSLNAGRTNYVYAEDEYFVMSDGSEQATGMTYYSIY